METKRHDSFEDARNHMLSGSKVIIWTTDEDGKRVDSVISGKEYGDLLSDNIKL